MAEIPKECWEKPSPFAHSYWKGFCEDLISSKMEEIAARFKQDPITNEAKMNVLVDLTKAFALGLKASPEDAAKAAEAALTVFIEAIERSNNAQSRREGPTG